MTIARRLAEHAPQIPTTTTTTTTIQLIVSGMHGDRGDLAAPHVAEVPSLVPGLRHSRQQMAALHAQGHPLKPKPATKMHAQLQWTARGTTGEHGDPVAHHAAVELSRAQGPWERSRRTEVPPVRDRLTKAKAATINPAQPPVPRTASLNFPLNLEMSA